MTLVLRSLAVAIAIAALLDPALRMTRRLPVVVRFHVDQDDHDGVAVRERLRRALKSRVEFRDYGTPSAIVALDDDPRMNLAPPVVPISTVSLAGDRDVAIVDAPASLSIAAGTAVGIRVALSGHGVGGTTSTVAVEESGVEIGHADHTWTTDGLGVVSIPYLAPAPGLRRVTIRVRPAEGESRLLNNAADVNVVAMARAIRVAVIETRPSWPAGFVRRALEDDPSFRVSSILRVSKGVSARSGDVPSDPLGRAQLDPFDVVLIGAPEELRIGEVDALRDFAAVRGGTVVLLPDATVGGAYRRVLPGAPHEELLRQPQKLAPHGLMASEVVSLKIDAPLAESADLRVLAKFADKPVVLEWPSGDGRFVFSGALDAWRYRAAPISPFTQFWRQTVLAAGLAAPPRLSAFLTPAVVRPGDRSRLTVRMRRTEFRNGAAMPSIEATIVDATGQSDMIRLTPTPEPGVFEGDVHAAATGLHHVRAATATGASADTVLIVAPDASTPRARRLTDVPDLTGGVSVDASNIAPLIRHLSSIPGRTQEDTVYPMRSAWWMIPFAGALSAEWLIRRRRGER